MSYHTLHLKEKKCKPIPPVLDTMKQNWFCLWSRFCCRGSLSHLKSTRWQLTWSKMHLIKKQTPLLKPTFCDLQFCTLVPGWLEHFKWPKNVPCLWFGRFSSLVKRCTRVYPQHSWNHQAKIIRVLDKIISIIRSFGRIFEFCLIRGRP